MLASKGFIKCFSFKKHLKQKLIINHLKFKTMKKVVVMGSILAGIFFVTSCNKKNNLPINSTSSSTTNLGQESTLNREIITERPRLKFKHAGVTKPGEPPKGCEVPLGICFIFGIQENLGNLTDTEIKEGINTATIYLIDNNHLCIIPDTVFSYPEGYIEIEGNFHIDNNVANKLGYKKILVKKGVYNVNYNLGKYESVTVDVVCTPKN
jgi:hypothetical protein